MPLFNSGYRVADSLKYMRAIASVATIGLVLGLAACGPPRAADLEGREFSSVDEFQQSVTCGQHFRVFPEWVGEPPVIETEGESIEMSRSLLGDSGPKATQALRAGDVWLLVDADGFAFAAMESVGASIGGCSDY